MKKNYVLKTFCILTLCCLCVVGSFFATNLFSGKNIENYDFQNFGLTYVQNALKHPIRVQINIENDAIKHKISCITFDDHLIDLKNISSKEHKAYCLNVFPGKYTISWQVDKELEGFIQKKTFFQNFTIDKTQLWVHINIKGDTITIN